MILSMSRQTLLFFTTVGLGMLLGLVFDVFRVFRKTAPHGNWIIQIEDLLFWLTVTLLTFYFLLSRNYGEIRVFTVLGILIGMTCYFVTISRLVMMVSVTVIQFLKRVTMTVLQILLTPFKLIYRLLAPPIKHIFSIVRKYLHSLRLYVKMKLRKTAGQWSIIRKKI